MAASSCFSLSLMTAMVVTVVFSSKHTVVNASVDHQIRLQEWMVPIGSGGCGGTIGDCSAEEEFELDSESNRRILATTRYVSYGALQKNNVPCSQRGASYYNCRQGGQANPYTRGCSAITRCRS